MIVFLHLQLLLHFVSPYSQSHCHFSPPFIRELLWGLFASMCHVNLELCKHSFLIVRARNLTCLFLFLKEKVYYDHIWFSLCLTGSFNLYYISSVRKVFKTVHLMSWQCCNLYFKFFWNIRRRWLKILRTSCNEKKDIENVTEDIYTEGKVEI